MSKPLIQAYTSALQNLTSLVKDIEANADFLVLVELVVRSFKNGGKLLICGNGGSHCSALHIAEEFTGRFRKDRRPLPAIALGEATHVSCVSNDYSFKEGIARQLAALAKPEDVLLILSTSGNSSNLVIAAEVAKNTNLATLAFLGRSGGDLKEIADVSVVVPGETSDRIQELQMLLGHLLVECVERELFPENYTEIL